MMTTSTRSSRKPRVENEEFTGFRAGSLHFLRRLARNNRREWFEAHRDEYEAELLRPMRAFVEEMDARLARKAPELVGDPRRSIFRIHRDVRFSRDKRPYKQNAACWFFHQDSGRAVGAGSGPDGGAAGIYVHLAPGECFVGGGLWMPPRSALARVRVAIVERQAELESILGARAFRRAYGQLDEERMLTRVPRGFDRDAPAARWLRYVSFTATREIPDRDMLAPDLPRRLERDVRILLPFIRWINDALGYPARPRRL